MTGLTGTSPTGMWVWQLFLFMKVVGVSQLCVWMRANRCQLWSVCYYLSCLFPWLWWRDLGFGPSGVTTLSGILVLFFFWFVRFFSFSGSSVSVNVKKTNKELCKLTFLFPGCFAVWEILENLEGKKPKPPNTPVVLHQKGDERHLVDTYHKIQERLVNAHVI